MALPLIVLYLPATQVEHTPPSGPVNPALQIQATTSVLDVAEFEFVGHVKHTDDVLAPTVVEYVPTPQSVHAALPLLVLNLPEMHSVHEPSGPVLPGEQGNLQASIDELELGEIEFSGHDMQVDDVVAPNAPEYVFTPQSIQEELPLIVLYLPTAHAEHSLPSGPVNPALHTH